MLLIKKVRQQIIPLHIFFAVLLIAGIFAYRGVDPHHDGLVFKPALDVVNGRMLYRETYSLYGGVTVLLQAVAIKIVGPYVIALRWLTAVTYAATAVLLWNMWTRFLSKKWALFSIVLWICLAPYFHEPFYPWSSIYATFFVTLAIDRFLAWIQPNTSQLFKSWQLTALGAISALAFLSKQPYVLTLLGLVGFQVLLWLMSRMNWKVAVKNSLLLFVGFMGVVGAFLSWVILNGALHDFWLQTVRIGYIYGKVLGISYSRHQFFVTNGMWLVIVGFVLLLGIWSIKALLRERSSEAVTLLGAVIILLTSIVHYFPVFDHSHAYWAATPAIGFCVAAFISLVSSKPKHTLTTAALSTLISLTMILVTVSAFQGVHRAWLRQNQHCVIATYPAVLTGLCLSEADSQFYQDVAVTIEEYLAKNSTKQFVMNTEEPLYVTFTNRSVYPEPLFFNNSGYTSGIYPFEQQQYTYAIKERPLVLVARKNINWLENYHILKTWAGKDVVLMASD